MIKYKPCEPCTHLNFLIKLVTEETSVKEKKLLMYNLKQTLPYVILNTMSMSLNLASRYINIHLPVTQLMSGCTGIIRHEISYFYNRTGVAVRVTYSSSVGKT